MQPSEAVITLHPLREDDIPLLREWLRRPHVIEWWGGHAAPSIAETREKYLPRAFDSAKVRAYIAQSDRRPIGYAQSYVALNAGEGWWEDEIDPGVRGIDQFLCDGSSVGQGLGTRMVTAFVRMLFSQPGVTRIQADPSPDNTRAIRCYEKSGFRRLRNVLTPDGPALLMVQDNPFDQVVLR
jgi:AacA4 family aminoglycoside N(6')-acetyltransferase